MREPILSGSWVDGPRVQVVFDDLDPATQTVTVWRSADVVTEVPGTVRVFAAGGFTVVDYWVPHSVEVEYWADQYNAAGTFLGSTGRSSVTVWGDRSVVVVSDPFDPENSVVVSMDTSFGEGLSRRRPSESFNVSGRVVALLGQVGLFEGVDLSLKSDTAEQRDRLDSILTGGLVLFRVAPGVRPKFPTVFYATTQFDIVDAPHLGGHQFGGDAAWWTVKGDQVSPITVGAAVAAFPYQRYMDAFATYADAMAAYSTYLDARRNPPGV